MAAGREAVFSQRNSDNRGTTNKEKGNDCVGSRPKNELKRSAGFRTHKSREGCCLGVMKPCTRRVPAMETGASRNLAM